MNKIRFYKDWEDLSPAELEVIENFDIEKELDIEILFNGTIEERAKHACRVSNSPALADLIKRSAKILRKEYYVYSHKPEVCIGKDSCDDIKVTLAVRFDLIKRGQKELGYPLVLRWYF